MKLHPLSIPYRTVTRGLSLGSTLVFLGLTLSGTGVLPVELTMPLIVGLAVAVLAMSAGWQVAYYRRFDYELTGDGLDIRSGVVSRRNREIPLGRVQNVDISRNVVQRALGLAALDLETAGGGQTEASLRYVSYEEAKRLQREIQRLKRGAEAETPAGEEPAADPEEELFALTDGELALLSVLSLDPRYMSVLAFGPALFPFVPGIADLALLGGLMLAVVLAAGVWVISTAVTFARYYGFRLTRVGDELRYERGLLQRYDGSIPLAKIQALTLSENAAMRRLGYARLAVETAGYGPGQSPSGGSEAAVPLATRERVARLAREVEPFDPPTFSRPPKRARTRYAVRYLLALAGLAGAALVVRTLTGFPDVSYLPLAPIALVVFVPVAAHLKWANRGYAAGRNHAMTRNGFWRRTTKVAPYYRVQTIIRTQTVFQRRRRLASVVVDTASSAGFGGRAAVAADLDAEDATAFRETVGERLQDSLTERRRGGEDGDADAEVGGDPSGNAEDGSDTSGDAEDGSDTTADGSHGEDRSDDPSSA